jgi:hypothetical protein
VQEIAYHLVLEDFHQALEEFCLEQLEEQIEEEQIQELVVDHQAEDLDK